MVARRLPGAVAPWQRHRHDRHGQLVVAQGEPGVGVVALDRERRGGGDEERQRSQLAYGLAAAEHDVEDLLEPGRELGRAERVLHVLAERGEDLDEVAHEARRLLVVGRVVGGTPVEADVVESVEQARRGEPVVVGRPGAGRGSRSRRRWWRRRRRAACGRPRLARSSSRGAGRPARSAWPPAASERSTSAAGKRTHAVGLVAPGRRPPARMRRPSAVSQRMPMRSSTASVRSWTCARSARTALAARFHVVRPPPRPVGSRPRRFRPQAR